MSLPVNVDDNGYKFFKTLNEDIKLVPDEYGVYDILFEDTPYDTDLVNVTGGESLVNGCIIAIMTRYKELESNKTYNDFGCRVHELIKANRNSLTKYKVELFITDTLERIRRIKSVDEVNVMESNTHNYSVYFIVTTYDDETVKAGVVL